MRPLDIKTCILCWIRMCIHVFTCTSSSVHTFLSIFRLRTFEMLGPSPLCSPETAPIHTHKSTSSTKALVWYLATHNNNKKTFHGSFCFMSANLVSMAILKLNKWRKTNYMTRHTNLHIVCRPPHTSWLLPIPVWEPYSQHRNCY